MSLAKQEFTDAGRSMLGRAQNREILTISKIVVGSGSATTPDELWPLIALKTFEMDVVISAKRDYGQGTLLVEGSLRSDTAPHAFLLKEVGIMAHVGSEADRLYSVANVFADDADLIDPAAPTIQVFKIKLIIDRIPAGSLVVNIGPSENVLGENIGADTVGPGVYRDAAGNVLYFKRLVQGTAMEIHDSEDGDSIYIGTSVLHNNVDLYVPKTYPGITDPDILFDTIQEAHDSLLKFTIPPDKIATIHCDAGVFDGRIGISHPNGQQIFLVGRPRVDKVVTAVNYVDPTHKNVGCPAAPLIAGYPVYLMNVDAGWAGGCYVTAASGNVVTCSTIKRDTQPTYNVNDSGTYGAQRRLSYHPSVIYLANPNPGQPWPATHVNVAAPNGLNIQNFTIIGGYHCLALGGNRCTIKDIMCMGGGVGINVGNLVVVSWPSDIVVTDCDFGFGGGGTLVGHNLNVNICANACDAGISCGDGSGFGAIPGVPSVSGKIYLVHNGQGVRNWGQTISMGNVLYVNNNVGIEADYGGIMIFGQFSNFCLNNAIDLKAYGMAFITYKKGSGAEPICSPPKDTAGNIASGNSFIHVVP